MCHGSGFCVSLRALPTSQAVTHFEGRRLCEHRRHVKDAEVSSLLLDHRLCRSNKTTTGSHISAAMLFFCVAISVTPRPERFPPVGLSGTSRLPGNQVWVLAHVTPFSVCVSLSLCVPAGISLAACVCRVPWFRAVLGCCRVLLSGC